MCKEEHIHCVEEKHPLRFLILIYIQVKQFAQKFHFHGRKYAYYTYLKTVYQFFKHIFAINDTSVTVFSMEDRYLIKSLQGSKKYGAK